MKDNETSRTIKFKMVLILMVVAALSLGIYVMRGNEVTINVDGRVMELVSYSSTVEELLEAEEIPFSDRSFINVPLDSKLENDIEIIIRNPIQYSLEDRGILTDTSSIYKTVGEILEDHNIELGEKDYTIPELSAKLAPHSTIRIFRHSEEIEILESTIPFEERIVDNRNLDAGTVKLVQEGKEGLKETHIKKEYINGELVAETIVKEEVVVEPVEQIKERGTRRYIQTSRGNTRYSKAITMTATAYDLSFQSTGKRPGDKYYGITASGTKARPGVVAVDPRVIPLGTRLYVKSLDGSRDYGFAVAEDRGGAIKGNRIDLFFETASEVRQFGRRKVKVYVLD